MLRIQIWRPSRSVHKLVTGHASPQTDRLEDPNSDRDRNDYVQNRLMLEAIGMKLLISHSATPTITNATTMFIKGIFFPLP
jgi:hypothetical protein